MTLRNDIATYRHNGAPADSQVDSCKDLLHVALQKKIV